MIYPLTVTPEELRQIEAAEESGIDVPALLKDALTHLPSHGKETGAACESSETDRTLELLDAWLEEAENATLEEVAEAETELAEFKASMDNERERTGARPLYR